MPHAGQSTTGLPSAPRPQQFGTPERAEPVSHERLPTGPGPRPGMIATAGSTQPQQPWASQRSGPQ
eukprot:14521723-Heterocapsa_arctica.AAC.1